MNKQKKIILRTFAMTLWVSFLMACIATAIFFAMFDPVLLGHITTWPIELTRLQGYSIGFFLFWLLISVSSLFNVIVLTMPSNYSNKKGMRISSE